MKRILIAAMVSVLTYPSAFAQGSLSSTRTISPNGSTKATGNAPVGHRQPTAADVGKDSATGFERSAEDRALDRKLKSICKGC